MKTKSREDREAHLEEKERERAAAAAKMIG